MAMEGDARMTITISSDLESRLREYCTWAGRPIDVVAEALRTVRLDDDAMERDENIQGIQHGLDDVAVARVRPLIEFISDEHIKGVQR